MTLCMLARLQNRSEKWIHVYIHIDVPEICHLWMNKPQQCYQDFALQNLHIIFGKWQAAAGFANSMNGQLKCHCNAVCAQHHDADIDATISACTLARQIMWLGLTISGDQQICFMSLICIMMSLAMYKQRQLPHLSLTYHVCRRQG